MGSTETLVAGRWLPKAGRSLPKLDNDDFPRPSMNSEPSPKTAKEEEEDHVDWEGLRRRSVLPGGFGHERVSIWCVPCPSFVSIVSCVNRPSLLHVNPSTPPRDDDVEPAHADEYQIRLDTERSFVFYPVGEPTPPPPPFPPGLIYIIQQEP